LKLSDVSRSLGRDTILSRTSLEFPSDTPTAVLGLGAPAREAFLRVLAGVDKPQTGSVRLGGKDIADVRRDKGGIVRVSAGGMKLSGQRVRKLIGEEAAGLARLGGKLDARVSDLDLDQRLRLAIAIARSEAELILLDSPGGELDLEIRERFVGDLKQMLSGSGAVVVLAAGSPDEARWLDGMVLVLDRGRMVHMGPAADAFAHPASLAVALATSHPVLNTLTMTARDGQGVLADGSIFQPPEGVALPEAGGCTLAFRPDDTALERAGAACLRFVVRAAGAEELGGRRFVRVSFAGSTWLTPQPVASAPPGMLLNAFVDRSRLMVFDSEGKAVA
jgi:ABC-type sulfate/molybdate transport systems ATPase subunit